MEKSKYYNIQEHLPKDFDAENPVEIVKVKKMLYKSFISYMTNSQYTNYLLSEAQKEKQASIKRANDAIHERNKQNTGFLSGFCNESYIKEPSKEYWEGFEAGISYGVDYLNGYWSNSAVSEEESKEVLTYLANKGISFMATRSGAIIMQKDRPLDYVTYYKLKYNY